MARDSMIRVNEDEKSGLDRVAEDRYNTDEVPYGHVIDDLTSDYFEGGEN